MIEGRRPSEDERPGVRSRLRDFSWRRKPAEKEKPPVETPAPASYRQPGELEQAHPDIEPLPPTPVTGGAREKLHSWGVPDPFIDRLAEVTSSFRYDLGPEKAERIVQNGGILRTDEHGTEKLILPGYHNGTDRGDGECGDLGRQLLRTLEKTGFTQELNEHLKAQGKSPISTHLIIGREPTFFGHEEDQHGWIGLSPDDTWPTKMVTVDPSLQTISDTEENGYQPESSQRFLFVPIFGKHSTDMPNDTELAFDRFTQLKNGSRIAHSQDKALGISADRAGFYTLTFSKVEGSDRIVPQVLVTSPTWDRKGQPPCMYAMPDGKIAETPSNLPMTDSQREEVTRIVQTLGKFSIRRE